MVIVVCFSSSVQVLDLPGNILHHLISVYSFDVFDPPRQVFVDSQLTTFRFVCSLKLKKIILISLSEFKYLHECCPDRKFSKCLSSYLKRCKSSPVLFVASHFQPSISNGPMRIYTLWKPLMKPDLPSDMRIDHMAVGLWARLRHLWQQKHQPMKKRKNVSKHHIPLPVNSSLISLYPHVNMLVSRI